MSAKTVAIIGAGRVGGAIGRLLSRAGYRVTAVAARKQETAEKARAFIGNGEPLTDAVKAASLADIVFITTPDSAIKSTAEAITAGGGFRAGMIVIHTSGAQTLDLLQAARLAGADRAVLHPLQSVPSMDLGVKNIPESYFRVEADPESIAVARELVKALGGTELAMPGWTSGKDSTALYHAGAVAASNFFVALVDLSLRFYEALGAERKDALKAVLPLIKGTLANIESAGVPEALTGPIMRGDVQTVRGHLEAIAVRTPELAALYTMLARHTVVVAQDKGSLGPEAAAEMLGLLK
jgi:predicted short-subunit dehydrogenase-like oxidoreductase (DUF2520 family)